MHIAVGPWILSLTLGVALCGIGCSGSGSSVAAAGGSAGVGGGTTGGSTSGGNTANGGNVSSDYQPVSVTNSGSQYSIQMGPIRMVVDAGTGARVTEFSFNGSNVLTG